MKNFFKIISLAKNYRASLGLNVVFNIIAVLFGLFSFLFFMPFLTALFNSDVLKEVQEAGAPKEFNYTFKSLIEHGNYWMSEYLVTHSKFEMLILLCGIILGMIFIKNIARYLALFFMAGVRNGIVRDYRNKIYSKILSLPLSYFSDERKGDIISKMTNDVKEIEWSVLRSLEAVYRDPIAIILTIGTLIFISPQMSLFILLLIPIVVLIALITRKLRKASANSQGLIGDMISTTEETLSGLKIIKGFNGEQIKKEKFENLDSYKIHYSNLNINLAKFLMIKYSLDINKLNQAETLLKSRQSILYGLWKNNKKKHSFELANTAVSQSALCIYIMRQSKDLNVITEEKKNGLDYCKQAKKYLKAYPSDNPKAKELLKRVNYNVSILNEF